MSPSAPSPREFDPAGEWAAELAELQQRRAQARAMGGPEALAKFKASGRLNARERIAALLAMIVPRRNRAEIRNVAPPSVRTGSHHGRREGEQCTARNRRRRRGC